MMKKISLTDEEMAGLALRGAISLKLELEEEIENLKRMIKELQKPFLIKSGKASGGMGIESRTSISATQKGRWEIIRAQKEQEQEVPPAKPRRKMSAAARKRIAEGQKKRWAAFRALKGQEEAPSKKKRAAKPPKKKR